MCLDRTSGQWERQEGPGQDTPFKDTLPSDPLPPARPKFPPSPETAPPSRDGSTQQPVCDISYETLTGPFMQNARLFWEAALAIVFSILLVCSFILLWEMILKKCLSGGLMPCGIKKYGDCVSWKSRMFFLLWATHSLRWDWWCFHKWPGSSETQSCSLTYLCAPWTWEIISLLSLYF